MGLSRAWMAGLIAGCACLSTADDPGQADPFARYQVILDRAPFGAAAPAPVEPPAPPEERLSFARNLRLTSIIEQGGVVSVGLVDTESGRSFFLRMGDPDDEFELVRASMADEEAVLRQGDDVATLQMGPGAAPAAAPAANPAAAAAAAARAEGMVSRRPAWAQRARRTGTEGAVNTDPASWRNTRPRPSREEVEAYQQDLISQGLPPLPVPLTPQEP